MYIYLDLFSYMKIYSKTQVLYEYLNSSNQQEEGVCAELVCPWVLLAGAPEMREK